VSKKENKKESTKTARLIQPPNREDVSYYLSVTMERSGPADGSFDLEPESYVTPVKVQINCIDKDDDTSVVGEIYADLIEIDRALRVGVSTYNIFDIDARLWEFYEGLCRVYEDLTEAIESVCPLGTCFNYDVLLLATIQIEPAHRGDKLGLYATAGLIDLFQDHCAIALMQPFPMQFGASAEIPKWMRRYGKGLGSDEQPSLLTLQNYWKQLGFRQFKETPYFTLSMEEFDLRKLFAQTRS
jgi:hypothetical protein